MDKYAINVAEHTIAGCLQGFEIFQKPSTTIDYYGTNGTDAIFIQFNHGVSYIYQHVEKADIEAMHRADSIGRFMSDLARKGYEFTKIKEQLVKSKSQEESVEE